MKKIELIAIIMCLFVLAGCTKEVPAGYKGRVKTRSGWQNELSSPGRVSCWGRDKLYLVEIRDTTLQEKLNILLKEEKVNFGITIATTFTISEAKENVFPLFDKVQAQNEDRSVRSITLKDVYDVYARPVLQSIPKQVIRNYTTDKILAESSELEAVLAAKISEALKKTPIQVKRIAIVNMDFPKFITAAQEKAKMAEVAIREEENNQKRRLVEEQNKRKLAEIQYQTALLEAKKIADANKLIGESLMGESGKAYLRWHEIKVYGEAANGPNNCIFLPLNLTDSLKYEATMTPVRPVLNEAINQEQ